MVWGFGGKSEVAVADCVIAGGEISTRVLVAPACTGTDKTGSSPCVDSGGVRGTRAKLSERKLFFW